MSNLSQNPGSYLFTVSDSEENIKSKYRILFYQLEKLQDKSPFHLLLGKNSYHVYFLLTISGLHAVVQNRQGFPLCPFLWSVLKWNNVHETAEAAPPFTRDLLDFLLHLTNISSQCGGLFKLQWLPIPPSALPTTTACCATTFRSAVFISTTTTPASTCRLWFRSRRDIHLSLPSLAVYSARSDEVGAWTPDTSISVLYLHVNKLFHVSWLTKMLNLCF